MKSFTKPLLFGVLAVGVSANGYQAVNTPCTTATPVTPQYQTSELPPPPVYTAPTVVPPPAYSSPAPPASSAPPPPPEVTCPYTYVTSCAYLCKGSNGVAYCSGSDATTPDAYTSCTACPGAPAPSTSVVPPPYTPPAHTEPSSVPPPYTPPPSTLHTVPTPSPTPEVTCPYTYAGSCAYLCKGGAEQVAYCSDKDVSSDYGKISCSACPGAPVPQPPNNGTSVPTYPPSTPTYTPPAPTNGTNPYPTAPPYNSGATALNIGTAAIFGLICMMFVL